MKPPHRQTSVCLLVDLCSCFSAPRSMRVTLDFILAQVKGSHDDETLKGPRSEKQWMKRRGRASSKRAKESVESCAARCLLTSTKLLRRRKMVAGQRYGADHMTRRPETRFRMLTTRMRSRANTPLASTTCSSNHLTNLFISLHQQHGLAFIKLLRSSSPNTPTSTGFGLPLRGT